MYDDVLLPTDGSDAARQAIGHAVDIAAHHDARLHALYVRGTSADPSLSGGDPRAAERADPKGVEAIDEVDRRGAAAGLTTITEIGEGPPAETIVHYVGAHGVDLVAMGTNGRQGLERYVIGSVTEEVVRTSPAPVLTVRYAGE